MSNILREEKDGICFLTINRPDKLNALNRATIKELGEAVKEAENNSSINAIIITGAGEKAFVAGADIAEFYEYSEEEGKDLAKSGQEQLFDAIENCETPCIAAVNGFALGGGLELAMSCHIRVASTNAKMGLPEVSLGVIPGYGGTQRLAQLAGKGKAFEMIFTAAMMNANDAEACGLVNAVVEQSELVDHCIAIARKLSRNSSVAIAAAVRAINAAYRDGENGYEKEIEEFGKCFNTQDFKEGTKAFMEKRKAEFPGK